MCVLDSSKIFCPGDTDNPQSVPVYVEATGSLGDSGDANGVDEIHLYSRVGRRCKNTKTYRFTVWLTVVVASRQITHELHFVRSARSWVLQKRVHIEEQKKEETLQKIQAGQIPDLYKFLTCSSSK